jgi:hypothetical protein
MFSSLDERRSGAVGGSVGDTIGNDTPVAQNDSAWVDADSSGNVLTVLDNDADADGGALSIESVGVPAHGSVSIAKSGASLVYIPPAGFHGGDTFAYTIADESGDRATASVTVWVSSYTIYIPLMTSSGAPPVTASTLARVAKV